MANAVLNLKGGDPSTGGSDKPRRIEYNGEMIVYKITNLVNGKFYIGITKHRWTDRWAGHKWSAKKKSSMLIARAINKYGPEMFKMSLLKTCESVDEMIQEEIRLIAALKPHYNKSRGGEASKYYRPTPESIEKTAAKLRGRPSWNKGITHSEATRKKLSACVAGKPRPRTDKAMKYWNSFGERMAAAKRKAIICVNDGKEYSCAREAAEFYGIRKEDIRKAVVGICKKTHGFQFRYADGN